MTHDQNFDPCTWCTHPRMRHMRIMGCYGSSWCMECLCMMFGEAEMPETQTGDER